VLKDAGAKLDPSLRLQDWNEPPLQLFEAFFGSAIKGRTCGGAARLNE
jgi:hypothetical protein